MSGYEFLHPERVHLAWAALAVIVVLALGEAGAKAALARFLSPVMEARLAARPSRARRGAKVAFSGAALLLGVLALMRPQGPGHMESGVAARASADVMLVLDVSKSMLAEDAAPSRLERARADALDLVDRLHAHRLGLVAFAGRAVVLCPLTTDHAFLRTILGSADERSVSRGGTRIGDALRTAVRAFGEGGAAGRLILLVTDGEDHESHPDDAAREAKAAGVRVVTIGFGAEQGSELFVRDRETGSRRALLDGNGAQVRSRLDGELLRRIALATEGAYVPAGISALDLDAIVREHVEPLARAGAAAPTRRVPDELHPWFVLGALLSVLGAGLAGLVPRVAGAM